MKKTVVTLTTVAVVGLGSAFFSVNTHAESVDALKEKQSQIQEDREEIKADLSEAESKIADVLIDLEELNKEIERTNEAMKKNQNKMDDTEKDIEATKEKVSELEDQISVLEDAIEERYNILKERVVSYQKNGGDISYLEVLFGAKSFGDFVNRVSAVNKISDSDKKLMEKQEADKKEVEEKKDEVVTKLDELKEMKVELEGMLALIKDQKEENKNKKAILKDKKSELVVMKEDLQVKDSDLASLEKDVKQSIEEATAPVVVQTSENNSNTSDGGNLSTLSSEKASEKKSAPVAKKGNGNLSAAINAGFPHIGLPYVWGGKTTSGFDCSGFVSWAFAQAGYSLPSSTAGLSSVGTKVSYSEAQPGDLVFFNTYKTNGHVGIYLGNGKFIGAQSSTGLAVANMTSGYWKDTFSGHVRRVN
ncbi:C40 family peptidase [Oceanobacillus manasiensis]|uniref:C40 family peptidase n=1 Tax=Oceanobacillus manasiensis TaxID=586413 RepID=UPI0005AA7C87|nr:C40 family peptidase [Oceanobacillus manasiensis]